MPVTTFSTRKLTLSNSIGIGSRFFTCNSIGTLAGARICAGSKRWFFTLMLTLTGCCALACKPPAVRTGAGKNGLCEVCDHTADSQLEFDRQLQFAAVTREFRQIEVRARTVDVAALLSCTFQPAATNIFGPNCTNSVGPT